MQSISNFMQIITYFFCLSCSQIFPIKLFLSGADATANFLEIFRFVLIESSLAFTLSTFCCKLNELASTVLKRTPIVLKYQVNKFWNFYRLVSMSSVTDVRFTFIEFSKSDLKVTIFLNAFFDWNVNTLLDS